MREIFFDRFIAICRAWMPELLKLSEIARYLRVNVQVLYGWKNKRIMQPEGGEQEIAKMLDRLRERGADPHALASWSYRRTGEMPRPAGLAAQPETRDPAPAPVLGGAPATPAIVALARIGACLRDIPQETTDPDLVAIRERFLEAQSLITQKLAERSRPKAQASASSRESLRNPYFLYRARNWKTLSGFGSRMASVA